MLLEKNEVIRLNIAGLREFPRNDYNFPDHIDGLVQDCSISSALEMEQQNRQPIKSDIRKSLLIKVGFNIETFQ